MELNEYQRLAMTTCMDSCNNFGYMMLNLVGEMGEFASKVAKQIRKDNVQITGNQHFSTTKQVQYLPDWDVYKEELEKEAGDILWQLAGLCEVMGWKLEDVADLNLSKLAARKAAGTIDGNGDGIVRGK